MSEQHDDHNDGSTTIGITMAQWDKARYGEPAQYDRHMIYYEQNKHFVTAALSKAREDAAFRAADKDCVIAGLRAETKALLELANGLSYYADGHELREPEMSKLRALKAQLAILNSQECVENG